MKPTLDIQTLTLALRHTAGYLTAAEVLLSSPSALTQRTKLPPAEVLHLLSSISHAVCSLPSTVDKSVAEIVEEEERKGLGAVFTTGDEGVDLLLGGGIRVGSLTELAGQSYVTPNPLHASVS